MKIIDLKQLINDLPDDMPVGLVDLTTDDIYEMNYPVEKNNFEVLDWVEDEDVKGKALFLVFKNKLNPNPI